MGTGASKSSLSGAAARRSIRGTELMDGVKATAAGMRRRAAKRTMVEWRLIKIKDRFYEPFFIWRLETAEIQADVFVPSV